MSLEENGKQKQGDQSSGNKGSDPLRQKLDAAISSYFLDGAAQDGDVNAGNGSRSLLDIVKDVLDEKDSPEDGTQFLQPDNGPVPGEPVGDEFTDDPDVHGDSDILNGSFQDSDPGINDPVCNKDLDDRLFSSAFEKIEYQSVDIEVAEEDQSGIPEEDSRYAQMVKEALRSAPRQKVATVLDGEPESKGPVPIGWKQVFDGAGDEDVLPAGQKVKSPGPQHQESDRSSAPLKREAVPSGKEPALKNVLKRNDVPAKDRVPSKADSGKTRNSPASAPPEMSKGPVSANSKGDGSSVPGKKDTSRDDLSQSAKKEGPRPEVVLLYNERHIEHNPSSLSLKTHENPERLIKAMWYLEKSRIFESDQCTLVDDFDMASDEDILRVHEKSYVEFVRSYSSAGGGFLGDSTYMTSGTYDVARLSAGAAIKAGSLVADGRYPYAFVMTRPPGHHASGNKYGGFCLFNNVAILARYLQEKKNVGRVMIIDWDAHAGDGTMDIFYEDPTVMFLSLHRDPHGFYPRKGFTKETGNGPGRGYTVNVEMPVGSGDEEYAYAFEEVVLPVLRDFAPEFVICSCGFDAYYREKNIGLNLTSEGFHRMASMIRSLCPENFVLLMEGGYHDFNGQLCHSVISALLDRPNPVNDIPEVSSYKRSQQQQVLRDTKAKVDEVKRSVPIFI